MAIAAGNALITGRQIKNSSITSADVKNKSLTPKDFKVSVRGPRGLTGATGVTGAKGDKGDTGDKGDKGDPGPFLANLPSGQTIRGAYYILSTATAGGQYASDSISYVYPLSSAPATHFITSTAIPPAQCPGTNANPQASPGHLCVYEGSMSNSGGRGIDTNSLVTGKQGAVLYTASSAVGTFWSLGNWAVTAP